MEELTKNKRRWLKGRTMTNLHCSIGTEQYAKLLELANGRSFGATVEILITREVRRRARAAERIEGNSPLCFSDQHFPL